MKFEELKKFIKEDMRMAPGRLYQPIMIRTLIQAKNGEASKDEIIEAIKAVNPHKVPRKETEFPWKILTKNHKVAEFDKAKKVYRLLDFDTYTGGHKSAITRYCKRKISGDHKHPDSYVPRRVKGKKKILEELVVKTKGELSDLIIKFDKDKQCFGPNRRGKLYKEEEKKEIRNNFISEFPPDRIPKLKLDEYVAGKLLPNGDKNRTTFCWWLEHGTNDLGHFAVYGGKNKFGILYKEEMKDYTFGSKIEKANLSKEDAFDAIKSEITSVIKAGAEYTEKFHDGVLLVNKLKAEAGYVQTDVHLRILLLYYPDHFFGVTANSVLKNCMNILDFQKNEIPKDAIMMQIMLVKRKNEHPIMKKWSLYDYSYFLWNVARKTEVAITDTSSVVTPESDVFKKIEGYLGVQ